MPTFRFRAQAALDLRRTQDEAAQGLLAAAARLVQQAEDDVARATAAVNDAIRAASDCTPDITLLTWHRNWITSRQHHMQDHRRRLEVRRAEAQEAAAAAQAARRQLRTLERLRERAWRAFLDAERRDQQKALDALGTMRFAVRRIQEEERL